MTQALPSSPGHLPELTRPAPAAMPGPLDERFWDLVDARVRRLVADHPDFATFVGIHTEDDRLPEGTRDAVIGEIDAERRHLATVEALDEAGLSPEVRFERELEVHNLRRSLFNLETHRVWERRSTAMDVIGDAMFSLIARDFAPLGDRLRSITGRLEAIPQFLDENRSRASVRQVRLWQQLELEAADEMPGLFAEICDMGRGVIRDDEQRRLEKAAGTARDAVDAYSSWLRSTYSHGTDEWALGRDAFDDLISLRGFDGLDADRILEIGYEQLAANKAGRVAAAREIDPGSTEPEVVNEVRSDHPATFAEALEGYRDAMLRARAHIVEHRIATIPDDERIHVIATPDHLRNVIPFAAYFEPPKFDPSPSGIYVVTPSVRDELDAMREHNWASISNTSVHEAYPGHHLQLSVANRHPSLVRLLTDAPEFVEGWGMYSETLMREHGFDAGPKFWLGIYTDAIWRACRIILDVRMHRGEMSVDEATDFLARETSFEPAHARAEVNRYTYTPTYQLSYLLGKVLLVQLREDERRRLGDAFDLCGFHDTLLRNGSIPISFHRRLLASGSGSASSPRMGDPTGDTQSAGRASGAIGPS